MPKYNICASSIKIHLRYTLVDRQLLNIPSCVTNYETEMQHIDSANGYRAPYTSCYINA